MSDNYAVAFSGGGALGSWEVGAYEYILEHMKKNPAVVIGSSAGSLNAAAIYAGCSTDKMKELWRLKWFRIFRIQWSTVLLLAIPLLVTFTAYEIGRLWDLRWWCVILVVTSGVAITIFFIFLVFKFLASSILTTWPLRYLIENILKPLKDIQKGSVDSIFITATNLNQREKLAYYLSKDAVSIPPAGQTITKYRKICSKERFTEYLIGSSAIPVVFPHNKYFQFDGGVLNNHPLSIAHQLEVPLIFLLIPDTKLSENEQPISNFRIFNTISYLMGTLINLNLEEVIRVIKSNNANSLYSLWGPGTYVKRKVCIIRPTEEFKNLGVGLLSFGRKSDLLIADGYKAAKERIAIFDPKNEDTWFEL